MNDEVATALGKYGGLAKEAFPKIVPLLKAKDKDARKICGLSPMYTQLELLRGHSARLLMHDIAMEPQTESAVSFASIAID